MSVRFTYRCDGCGASSPLGETVTQRSAAGALLFYCKACNDKSDPAFERLQLDVKKALQEQNEKPQN